MKKLFAILLLAALLLTLFAACGKDADKDGDNGNDPLKGKFSVGYGKAKIMPENGESVVMDGHGPRDSSGFMDYLYVITVAITDEAGDTVLFITADLSGDDETLYKSVREEVRKKWDIPEDHIYYGATHTHTAPNTMNNSDQNRAYRAYMLEQVTVSVEAALADRLPAEMYLGRTETEKLNFVRRYWMKDPAGKQFLMGTNYYDRNLAGCKMVGHETEADPEMQLVKFTREGGKSIMMINWQAHAHMLGNVDSLSADYPGVLRETVEKDLGYLCVFYQGAAGNINPQSRIEGEQEIPTGEYRLLGKKLAEYVVKAEPNMTPAKTGKIRCKQQIYTAAVNHSQDNLLEAATKILDDYNQTKNDSQAIAAGEKYGIYGYMEASAIIARSKRGDTVDVELGVIAIGDLSFVTLPLEMFDISGMQIKSQTPFEMTLILGHTGSISRYAAPEEACKRGGYEVYNSLVVHGTAEEMVSRYLQGLNELHGD